MLRDEKGLYQKSAQKNAKKEAGICTKDCTYPYFFGIIFV